MLPCGLLRAQQAFLIPKVPIVTFASFLTNPPVIEEADFQIQPAPTRPYALNIMREQMGKIVGPEAAAQITASNPPVNCTLKFDGTNYLLVRSQAANIISLNTSSPGNGSNVTSGVEHPVPADNREYSGRFATVDWELQPASRQLTLYDSKIAGDNNLLQAREFLSTFPIRRLLNWGIQIMVVGSAKWLPGQDRFIAKSVRAGGDDGLIEIGNLEVRLSISNDLPISATVLEDGQATMLVSYRYDAGFFEGRIPVEFSAVNPAEPDDNIFSLRIRKLKLAAAHLDASELDPRQALMGQFARVFVVSNGVEYFQGKNGKLRAVMEAAAVPQRRLSSRQLMQRTTKALLVAAIFFPPLFFLVSHALKKYNLNSNNES